MNSISTKVAGHGLEFIILGRDDDPITRHHLNTGEFYEMNALSRISLLVHKLLKQIRAGYIIDAGANIGNHTLFLAAQNPSAMVHAFEMNQETFSYLHRNISKSNLNNVTINNYGLSSKSGYAGIKSTASNPLGGARLDFSDGNSSDVALTTLDNWAVDNKITDRCVLMKLDVEGHEYEVLKGAERLVEENRPMIYAELKELEEFNKFYSFLAEMGYTIAYAEEGALPNFLFIHDSELNVIFSSEELERSKIDLCYRLVEAWQLHRLIKTLRNSVK